MATLLRSFFARLGIHIHDWNYFTQLSGPEHDPWIDDMRECKGCGLVQQFFAIGSCALGIETYWGDPL